jgi:hypothetical protein
VKIRLGEYGIEYRIGRKTEILGAVFLTILGTSVHGLSMVSFPHSKM